MRALLLPTREVVFSPSRARKSILFSSSAVCSGSVMISGMATVSPYPAASQTFLALSRSKVTPTWEGVPPPSSGS